MSTILLCTAEMILLGWSSALPLGLFWELPYLQNRSLWGFLWASGKKSHTTQNQVNREVVAVQQCSSWPETDGCSGHCCGDQLQFDLSQLFLCSKWNTLQHLLVYLLTGWCTLQQRMGSTWLWLLTCTTLLSSALASSRLLWHLVSSTQFHPHCISSSV